MPSLPPLPWLWAQGQALQLYSLFPLKEPPADLGLTGLLEPAGLRTGEGRWDIVFIWASCLPWVCCFLSAPVGSQCQPSLPEPLNLTQLSFPTACFSTAPFPPNLCPRWSPHQPSLLSFEHSGSKLAWKGLRFPVYKMVMHPLPCLFCRVVGEFGGLVSGRR